MAHGLRCPWTRSDSERLTTRVIPAGDLQEAPSILRMPILVKSGVCGVRDFAGLSPFASLKARSHPAKVEIPHGVRGLNPSVSASKIPGKMGVFFFHDGADSTCRVGESDPQVTPTESLGGHVRGSSTARSPTHISACWGGIPGKSPARGLVVHHPPHRWRPPIATFSMPTGISWMSCGAPQLGSDVPEATASVSCAATHDATTTVPLRRGRAPFGAAHEQTSPVARSSYARVISPATGWLRPFAPVPGCGQCARRCSWSSATCALGEASARNDRALGARGRHTIAVSVSLTGFRLVDSFAKAVLHSPDCRHDRRRHQGRTS